MIKKISVIMALLLAVSAVNAGVIITEVLFNPISTEAGGEAVELYNPTEDYIDISGYVIATESSATDITIKNAVIRPYGFYLIADSGWSENKDNESWPNADYEETITMSNSDSGIALLYNSTTIDAVGWGEPSSIENDLYEGSPHPDIEEGLSLKRKITGNGFSDTNNNTNDFYASGPILRNSSFIQSFTEDSFYEINVTAVVTNTETSILSTAITTDDDNREGAQINPDPGSSREVNVRTIIQSSSDLDVFMIFESKRFNLSLVNSTSNNKTYQGSFGMEYYKKAGNYAINLNVVENSNIYNQTLYFEYMPMIGFEIQSSSLSYDVVPGGSSTNIITIKNTGNVNLDVEVFGTDLINGEDMIDAENIIVSFEDDAETTSFQLMENPRNLNLNLQPGIDSTKQITFMINIPSNAEPGSYSSSISIVGTGS